MTDMFYSEVYSRQTNGYRNSLHKMDASRRTSIDSLWHMEPTEESEVRSQRRHFNNSNKSTVFDFLNYENGDTKKDIENGSDKIIEEEESDEEKLPVIPSPTEVVHYDEEEEMAVEDKQFWDMQNGREELQEQQPIVQKMHSNNAFSESVEEGLQHKQKRHFVDRNRSSFQI